MKGASMKILAIIPARAGSKGVPNKNIRIVGDHPLIYYAIKNAKQSRYITDIVVSTDSPEVGIISKQMGVGLHWRRPELCADDVTLDAVIYDATQAGEWGYVVTLQPTSPTLSTKTLDEAIEYAIGNGFDTVISVVNDPHLAWKEKDDQIVPAYQKRLNRQYLPPEYRETGAFVIAKGSVIKKDTRIGAKVSVYQIPSHEAVDIDTFYDLRVVECILSEQSVAFYVNGNNKRGMGHIYRALELADEFFVKPDIYYDINQTDVRLFGSTTHNLIAVNGINDLFGHLSQRKYQYFINDILSTSIDYMIGLRNVLGPDTKIVNFEDDGEGIIKADLVFNALYHKMDTDKIYTGEKYYIASKLFLLYEPIAISEHVRKVFVSFGGADPQNYSDRLLEIVSKAKYQDFEFIVVLGRAKENISQLMAYNQKPNITVLYDVPNMAELMSQCDVAVTSRGRTGYELATLGIPAIAMAQNQREEKHGFVCNENGFFYLGLNPSDSMIERALDLYLEMNAQDRQALQDRLLQHDLRHGRKRVMSLIRSM